MYAYKKLKTEVVTDNAGIIKALIADRLKSKKNFTEKKIEEQSVPLTATKQADKTDKVRDNNESDDSGSKKDTAHETASSSENSSDEQKHQLSEERATEPSTPEP